MEQTNKSLAKDSKKKLFGGIQENPIDNFLGRPMERFSEFLWTGTKLKKQMVDQKKNK